MSDQLELKAPEKRKPVNPEMEDSKYRADPSISNSDLSLVQSSPKAFEGVKAGELEGFFSSGFKMGTALDIMILTPDLWESEYILEPMDMEKPSSGQQVGFVTDLMSGIKASDAIANHYKVEKKTDAAVAKMAFENIEKFQIYMDFQEELAKGKTSYSQKEKDDLLIMKAAIEDHDKAGDILMGEVEGFISFSQVAIFWSMLKIRCKGLLDRLLIDKKNKVIRYYDLKWTGKGVGYFEDSIRRYKYYRQLAYYKKGLEVIFPSFKIEVWLISVTPKWGGECRILEMQDPRWFEDGDAEYTELIDVYKWHNDNNKFGYRRQYYENNGVEVVPYVEA